MDKLSYWEHASVTICIFRKHPMSGWLSVALNEWYWILKQDPLLTSVPQVWPWAFSRDQCHVSPQLWRISRDGEQMRGKGKRDSSWHVSDVQRIYALTIGTWLTCVCARAIWDVYMYSWVGGVLEEGWQLGVMANLAPWRFWSHWLVGDESMVPVCLQDQLC